MDYELRIFNYELERISHREVQRVVVASERMAYCPLLVSIGRRIVSLEAPVKTQDHEVGNDTKTQAPRGCNLLVEIARKLSSYLILIRHILGR